MKKRLLCIALFCATIFTNHANAQFLARNDDREESTISMESTSAESETAFAGNTKFAELYADVQKKKNEGIKECTKSLKLLTNHILLMNGKEVISACWMLEGFYSTHRVTKKTMPMLRKTEDFLVRQKNMIIHDAKLEDGMEEKLNDALKRLIPLTNPERED